MKEKEKDAQVASTDEQQLNAQVPQVSFKELNSIFAGEMPDLTKSTTAPLELTGEYWTPENIGDTKRMFFSDFRLSTAIDQKTGTDVDLTTAYFIEVIDGVKKVICNASCRLVGALESSHVPIGTPLEIVYLGKKKNKNNALFCDTWSIKPLILASLK